LEQGLELIGVQGADIDGFDSARAVFNHLQTKVCISGVPCGCCLGCRRIVV
jgi:hypothetical protein